MLKTRSKLKKKKKEEESNCSLIWLLFDLTNIRMTYNIKDAA
jgi:hypothetical protein